MQMTESCKVRYDEYKKLFYFLSFVVLLYCKPEYRGRYLRYMFRRIEEIAKQEGAVKIFIGDSDSGYKEEKFNRVLSYFGYRVSGHVKEV